MANKVNVTPLHDRVIVKPAAAEEKTAGGIIIPDTAKREAPARHSDRCRSWKKRRTRYREGR